MPQFSNQVSMHGFDDTAAIRFTSVASRKCNV